MSQYVLAIDGGGTKTLCLIASYTGEVAGWGWGGPVNSNFVSDDVTECSLVEAISAAFVMTGLPMVKVEAGYVSAPGISHTNVARALTKVSGVQCGHLTVAGNDTHSAFTGALLQPPGIVVLAGTGSFALCLDEHGGERSVGGWGPLLGDEGSGYHIGLLALQRVARVMDGRVPASDLTRLVQAQLVCDSRAQLQKLVYKTGISRREIAAVAKAVSQAADAGDSAALEILEKAASALADLAIHLLHQVLPGNNYPVALTGGVANANSALFEHFSRRIQTAFPACRVGKGRFSPVIGAVLLCYNRLGVSLSESVLHNLELFSRQEGL